MKDLSSTAPHIKQGKEKTRGAAVLPLPYYRRVTKRPRDYFLTVGTEKNENVKMEKCEKIVVKFHTPEASRGTKHGYTIQKALIFIS